MNGVTRSVPAVIVVGSEKIGVKTVWWSPLVPLFMLGFPRRSSVGGVDRG